MTSSSSAAALPVGALANRLSAGPRNRVLVLEAGRPDYPWDVFVHMPAALTFPIGSRFYDWLRPVRARAVHGWPPHLPRPGKILGGSSSINGQSSSVATRSTTSAGRPTSGWRPGTTPIACRTSRRWSTSLAAAPDDPWRGHDGPLLLERGPAANPLFAAFFAAAQEAGYQLTDDVNGSRQQGFAPFDRNIHRRPPAVGRPGIPNPVRGRWNLTVRTRTFVTGLVFEGRGRSASTSSARAAARSGSMAGEIILAGGAFNSP